MLIYIDESGDIGWKFDAPYRFGGSSRYLTICSLIIPSDLKDKPKRIIRKLYTKKNCSPSIELKGSQLSHEDKEFLVDKTINLLTENKEIRITAITVKKENVFPHIRDDGNKIYNYMLNLSLLDEIKYENNVTLIPDPRSIKVASGNSMVDYLQMQLWFEKMAPTKLTVESITSEKSLNLQFIDMITHIVWDFYENGNCEHFRKLVKYIKHKDLYFS